MLKQILRSSLFRTAGVYTVSRVINAAIPFLMLPVMTRYLAPADYGIVAMFSILMSLSMPLIGLNIPASIGVSYFDKEIDLPRYIGNGFLLITITLAAVSLLMLLVAAPVSRLTSFPAQWLWTAPLAAFLQIVIMTRLVLWQMESQSLRFAVFQNTQSLFNVGLSVLFVVGLGMHWEGRVQAQLITLAGFAALGYYLLHRRGLIRYDLKPAYLRKAVRFGAPLIPHDLGGILINQVDRIFIANMVSIADAGIYSVGFQIASVIEIVASSFNQAYSPWLYRKLAENQESFKRTLVKYTYLYFVLIVLLAILFSMVIPWFLAFFIGAAFAEAIKYVFWIALGFSFSGMYYMVANYIIFAGRTASLAAVTAITSIVNIILNYLLIKRNGTIGAAQASAAALCISFLLTWFVSARVYDMPWKLWKKGSE